MTNTFARRLKFQGGRSRPPVTLIAAALVAICWGVLQTGMALAHAEPERTEPPMNQTVPVAPSVVEVWFDEEVGQDGTVLQVIGPGGIQVDLGDTTVDLMDPNRQHVTVSLRPNLGPGAYTVQWRSQSTADGDSAQGGYLFRVGAASPVASPIATPVTTPVATEAAVATPVVDAAAADPGEDDFDSQAFGISVAAGIVAAIAIYIFWRLVRPKNPKF